MIQPPANALRRQAFASLGLVILVAVMLLSGCQPKKYRLRADNEVRHLVQSNVRDPESPLNDFNIYANPNSRLFDPNPPDFEPMPPDDPRAATFMDVVDHKRGYAGWEKNGLTPFVENPNWAFYLCPDEDGTIPIDMRAAVALSLDHSRRYQSRLEDLYLAALDVSFERFRFDTQFFGGYEIFFTADGPDRSTGRSSNLSLATRDVRLTKLYATGGELVVGLANRLMWEFSGADDFTGTTLLDFSLIQPLLKRRGRLRVLEELTDAERALLAEVRELERFRRGFYANIVTGLNPDLLNGGNVAIGASAAGGFLGLLQDTQEIRNQQASVTGLRDSLDQLQAAFEADRIDRFQVDLARQALFAAQSGLISLKAVYQARLDAYKLTLGLPPEAPLTIDDPLLNRFNLLDPPLLELQEDVAAVIQRLRNREAPPPEAPWQEVVTEVRELLERSIAHVEIVEEDVRLLMEALPTRRKNLRRLASRVAEAGSDVDATAYSPDDLDRRVAQVQAERDRFYARVRNLFPRLPEIERPDQYREMLNWLVALSGELQELMLIQAGARLDTVTLRPIEIDSYQALQIARCNRRDLQNARADLVDAWRQVEFTKADLAGFLNVVFEGDISNVGDNPIRLRGTTGRLRVGAEFDAPLTRLVERNVYRAAQIGYQRARRDYYEFEDTISLGLRNTLRNAELNQLDFELTRAAVQVAISQVALTRLRLSEPPRVGATETFDSNTVRDLVTAIDSLLGAQNDILGVWINYQVLRLGLDFNLGTMRLDEQGMWIDPGVFSVETLPPCEDCVPGAPRAFDAPEYAVRSPVAPENPGEETIEPGPLQPAPLELEAPEQDELRLPVPEGESVLRAAPQKVEAAHFLSTSPRPPQVVAAPHVSTANDAYPVTPATAISPVRTAGPTSPPAAASTDPPPRGDQQSTMIRLRLVPEPRIVPPDPHIVPPDNDRRIRRDHPPR
ncbi:MAG: hypothetical protein DWQ42_21380 [Planctomycetota bacterium]|nr:MAG: hypothetical protein DWQ42_21380 [Planctomycetota bacterium]REK42408.1 MAG: hypothetical protein DWQ46_13530 [Planctomycetota bacterium]